MAGVYDWTRAGLPVGHKARGGAGSGPPGRPQEEKEATSPPQLLKGGEVASFSSCTWAFLGWERECGRAVS